MNQEQESFSTCEDCGSLSFSQQWHKAFGVRLCNDCRGGYGLISKGNAKQRYAVTDGNLRRLGTISKPNPQYKQGAPMLLLLEDQVREIAVAKHGSEDGIEAEVELRRVAKASPAKSAKNKAAERKAEWLKVRIDRESKRIAAQESLRRITPCRADDLAASGGEEVEEI